MNDFDAFLDIQRASDVTTGRSLTDDVVSIGLRLPKSAWPRRHLTTGDHRLASASISATTREITDDSSDPLHCGNCGRPIDDAPALSAHRTSQGPIGYRQCVCGRISVVWRGSVLGGAGPKTPSELWSSRGSGPVASGADLDRR